MKFVPRCFVNICIDTLNVTAPAESIVTQYMQGSFVHVTVTTTGRGTSATSMADLYSYDSAPIPEVTGISPSVGGAGTAVTITGSGLAGATDVTFGDIAATNVTEERVCGLTTPMECAGGGNVAVIATAPAVPFDEATGLLGKTVDVTVTTPRGTSVTSEADKFTYPSGHGPPAHGITTFITGSIAVTSFPPGAAIFLDGRWTRNVTPYTFDNIDPGNHLVTVRLSGFKPASRTVMVDQYTTATANFNYIHVPPHNATVPVNKHAGIYLCYNTDPDTGPNYQYA